MGGLFSILFFVSLLALILGLIKPSVISRLLKKELSRKKIGLLFGILALAFLILASFTTDTSSTNKLKAENTNIQAPTSQPTPTVQKKQEVRKQPKSISYEVIKTWSIPNGGFGKVVVIPSSYLNEADMTALGEKLKNDVKNDRNAFIFVFTDKKAAEMRDKVLTDELNDADRDFYDKHYVGQYNKNGNSGFNEFAIYFDGVMGTNQKTIKY